MTSTERAQRINEACRKFYQEHDNKLREEIRLRFADDIKQLREEFPKQADEYEQAFIDEGVRRVHQRVLYLNFNNL